MKLRYFTLLALMFMPYALISQVQSWPPGGTKDSGFELNLSDARFIPSSERYNLIWADQLVPAWITPGKVEFAAKNYVATQKIWDYQIAEFRQHNPDFICVIYHLALGLNPQDNSDCPDPKDNQDGIIGVVAPTGYVSEWNEYFLPWLDENEIEPGSDKFEDMFQHYDEFDPQHRVWHKDPYWLMDASDENWRKYLVESCFDWMEGNKNEGCFFDVAVETNSYLYNPNIYNPEPTNFEWWLAPHKPYNIDHPVEDRHDFSAWMNDMYLEYFQKIYNDFHSGEIDYLVIPNVDQMVTTVYDPIWMDGDENGEAIDGAMIESFGGYRGYDMHLTLSRCVSHITGRGKILIAQFYDGSDEERYRRTGMYMLVKNKNSYLNILTSGVEWYPEYEIDLGRQSQCPLILDELRISGEGWQSLWKRDYENGIVLCNTNDANIEYELPDDRKWFLIRTSGGGEVSDDGLIQDMVLDFEEVEGLVEVPASECLILKSELKSSVDYEDINARIYPNPFRSHFEIELSSESKCEINIYNLLGDKILSHLEDDRRKSINIDASNLEIGVYYLEIISKSKKEIKILIKN